MAKYKKFFVDHMMHVELHPLPPDEDHDVWKKSVVMFFAFLFFGLTSAELVTPG